jgi:MFS family permease
MIFLVVKESMQGTAYGIMVSCYNAGLILLPVIIGYIFEKTEDTDEYYGYYWVGIFFLCQACFSFLCLLVIMYIDRTRFGNSLSQPPPEYETTNESI